MIAFASVILIAVGIVWLIWFFYAQTRENAVLKGILASPNSPGNQIKKIKWLENCLDDTTITHDVLNDIYTLENHGNVLCNLSALNSKGIEVLSPNTYKIK